MANPVAHAMVYYADSPNYDALIAAAGEAANALRELVSAVPGEAVSVQIEPLRKEKHYNRYKGDGPARMMTPFRTGEKSEILIEEDTADNFDAVSIVSWSGWRRARSPTRRSRTAGRLPPGVPCATMRSTSG
jgi:hypothetical protein